MEASDERSKLEQDNTSRPAIASLKKAVFDFLKKCLKMSQNFHVTVRNLHVKTVVVACCVFSSSQKAHIGVICTN